MNKKDEEPKAIDLVRREVGDYWVRKPDAHLVEGEVLKAIHLRIKRFFGFNDNLAAALDSYEEVLKAAARVAKAELELEDSIDTRNGMVEIFKEKREIRKAEHTAKLALLRSIEKAAENLGGNLRPAELKELMELAKILKG
jgi:hypothetical protein